MTKKQTKPVKMATISLNQHDYLLKSSITSGHYLCHHFYPGYFKTLAKAQYWKKGAYPLNGPTRSMLQIRSFGDSNPNPPAFWSGRRSITGRFSYKYRTGNPFSPWSFDHRRSLPFWSFYIRQRMIQPTKRLTQRLSTRCCFYQARCDRRPGILEIDHQSQSSNRPDSYEDLQIQAYHAQLNLKKVELQLHLKNQSDPILPQHTFPWFTACSKPRTIRNRGALTRWLPLLASPLSSQSKILIA